MIDFWDIFTILLWSVGNTCGVPVDYCLHKLNTSNCGLKPVPVFSYYKPGSRCEISFWKGCPTFNKFADEIECSHICIARYRISDIGSNEIYDTVFDDVPDCSSDLVLDDCGRFPTEVFTFDHKSKACVKKKYRGCKTKNIFSDKTDCVKHCIKSQKQKDIDAKKLKHLLKPGKPQNKNVDSKKNSKSREKSNEEESTKKPHENIENSNEDQKSNEIASKEPHNKNDHVNENHSDEKSKEKEPDQNNDDTTEGKTTKHPHNNKPDSKEQSKSRENSSKKPHDDNKSNSKEQPKSKENTSKEHNDKNTDSKEKPKSDENKTKEPHDKKPQSGSKEQPNSGENTTKKHPHNKPHKDSKEQPSSGEKTTKKSDGKHVDSKEATTAATSHNNNPDSKEKSTENESVEETITGLRKFFSRRFT